MHTIFHAFNWRFSAIRDHLQWISSLGFNGIQISPAQLSFSVNLRQSGTQEWYHRYQPLDYSIIDGLGSAAELSELCNAAAEHSIIVIADVVFNHMGSVIDAHEASRLWKSISRGGKARRQAEEELRTKLDTFPQFDHSDFHPFRPIDGHDYDNDDLRYTGWGGAGTWPDLRPTERVLDAQRDHITLLHGCGVRGFRFDAVKQMFVREQYRPLVSHCRSLPGVEFIYGEVLSTRREAHAEYANEALTTDFLLMQDLVAAFSAEGDVSQLLQRESFGYSAVTFARNHDTVMQYLPTLSFDCLQRAALANVYLLLTQRSPALVLADDLKDERIARATRAALRLRSSLCAADWAVPPIAGLAQSNSGKAMESCLWIILPGLGAVFLNASEAAVDLADIAAPVELDKANAADLVVKHRTSIESASVRFFSRLFIEP